MFRIKVGMEIEKVLQERTDLVCTCQETEELCGEYECPAIAYGMTLVVNTEKGIITDLYTIRDYALY